MIGDAWINRVRLDFEDPQFLVDVAWDADVIDPLGASVVVRTEVDGLLGQSRQFRISDLPVHGHSVLEPRHRRWDERLLTVNLPRGARRTDWGVQLVSADGRLLDEWTVAPRVEQISFKMTIDDAEMPEETLVGDRREPPAREEQDELAATASRLDADARATAAATRLSSRGRVVDYLRSRFAFRAGELLIMDPYLGRDGDADTELAFLRSLDRDIRAMTAKAPSSATSNRPWFELRQLPSEVRLHDRIWIVGETAMLVGASLNALLKQDSAKVDSINTVSELPYADASAWREAFEAWWASSAARSHSRGR